MADCFIVSLSHLQRKDRYITFWRPDDKGYAYPLSWAGRYSEARVRASLDYYNTGAANIAVPCEVVEPMAVEPRPGDIENDAGPVVLNNAANWRRLIAGVLVKPPHQPEPVYRGAKRRQWENE